tara:strand:+ start:746 stop:1054 length:309 start_codon:yes stop_codon:yes gene_type:complete
MIKQWTDKDMLEFARIASGGSYGDYKGCNSLTSKLKKYKLMTKKVKKYSVELHLVEIEVDKDSMEEGYMEYDKLSSEEVYLNVCEDYDEAQELFNNYIKQLE